MLPYGSRPGSGARLSADLKTDAERDMLVFAALDGPDALRGYLDSHTQLRRPEREAMSLIPLVEGVAPVS